jgi:HK97 family phage portal protein
MAIVRSAGELQVYGGSLTPAAALDAAAGYGAYRTRFSNWAYTTYGEIYRRQPNVRTVVDFISRNIAQLGIFVYERVSDTDRVRIYDHPVAEWLGDPNPATTQYRLIESLINDLCIYWSAAWWKMRDARGRLTMLVRLPPEELFVSGYLTRHFVWASPVGTVTVIDPKDVLYITGYDPCNGAFGISPIETLRHTLAEGAAATLYRESFWMNAARLEGVIERPATAPKWTPAQKQDFRDQWSSRFTGPRNAGQTAVLEDGMTFKEMSQNAVDSEYIAARKLTTEECARAYHVPLPMVGILDHATFSNVKEQHKQLYQDTLGPWLEWIQQELEKQLLPEAGDPTGLYIEFNLADKLKGSFEEQAASLQALIGRPVMTANEGRARLNLPRMDDPTCDQLAAPLNMATAGAHIPAAADGGAAAHQLPPAPTATVIARTWDRQRQRVEKVAVADRAAAFDVGRWDRELAGDLDSLFRAQGLTAAEAATASAALAHTINGDTLQLLVARENPFSPAREAALYVQ